MSGMKLGDMVSGSAVTRSWLGSECGRTFSGPGAISHRLKKRKKTDGKKTDWRNEVCGIKYNKHEIMRGEKDRYRLDGVLAVEREMADGPGPMPRKCGRMCSL